MPVKVAVALALLTFQLIGRAEVLHTGTGGFSVSHTINAQATPADSWGMMTNHINQWWNPEHTWSGSSENLYIKPEMAGCLCERLPQNGGGVEHLRIIYLNPGHEIRFDGALGPLQNMAVQGRMIWKIEATESGSSITFTYHVHGALEGGFEGLAPAVDGVIGEQLERLGQRLQPH